MGERERERGRVRERESEREDVRALAAREEVCLHLRVSEGEEDSE